MQMTRVFTGLIRLIIFAPLICQCGFLHGAEDRPNILWIIAEDLSPDLACYGTPVVKTPNIDRLATQGVRYTKVFGTSSVCAVNRSSFGTGMYSTSIGAQHMRTVLKKPLPGKVRPVTEYFREAGYFVSNGSGKGNMARPLTKPGKVDWNFNTKEAPFDGTDWSQRKPGQAFFAQINISETHLPWTPDKQNPIDPASVTLPPYYPDHPLIRRHMASYLEEAQILDRKVGMILERLEKEGLAENTIVFFFGDNGRQFARGKGFLYDPGLQVPLIIRWPDGRDAGTVDGRLLSMIDLAPSIMKMVGLAVPSYMHGKPLLAKGASGREFIFAVKDRIGAVSDRVRCVRNSKYKYLRNFFPDQPYLPIARYSLMEDLSVPAMLLLAERGELNENQKPFLAKTRPPEELYDLESDPHELHNLAKVPAHQETLILLRGKLDEWIEETGDQGRNAESEESIAAYRDWLDKLVAKILKKRGIDKLDAESMYAYWMREYKLQEIAK